MRRKENIKGFKKEFTIEDPPNFNELSKEHPLPTEECQIDIQHAIHDSCDSEHCQASTNIANLSASGLLLPQPVNPLLTVMYHNICLRQQWLKQQILLNNARVTPINIGYRNRNLAEKILFANAMNQIQNEALL